MYSDNEFDSNGNYSGENNGGYYQSTSDGTGTTGEPSGTPGKNKKKGKLGLFRKGALVIALGLVFGVSTGAGLLAVQTVTESSSSGASIRSTQTTDSATATNEVQTGDTSDQIKTTTSTDTSVTITDVTEIVNNVMPAIVAIDNNYTETVQSMFGQTTSEDATASGSGIIVGKSDTELLIVTNNHVIENEDSLSVKFIDDTEAEANVKGTDEDNDLAVIAVELSSLSDDTLSKISVATLGDSDALQVGEPAIAIGNALGYGQSVTTGVISAVNREIEVSDGQTSTFIQTDAAINPGNSGGALINSKGEVIGINSNKIGGETIEGMGYAIPMSTAEPIIDNLMNQETKVKVSDDEKGALGISVMTPTGIEGAYVAAVEDGGAAQSAGIEVGDIITKLDDTQITSREDLSDALKYYSAGTDVTVTVLRRGDSGYATQDITVTLEKSTSQTTSTDSSASTTDGSTQSSGSADGSGSSQGSGSSNGTGSSSSSAQSAEQQMEQYFSSIMPQAGN